MGKIEELRDEILFETTRNLLDSPNCDFLSQEELSGLYGNAEKLFAIAFKKKDFKTTESILDLQEQIKKAQRGQFSNSREDLQKMVKAIQILSLHSKENSTRSSWYRALKQRLWNYERGLQRNTLQQTNNLDRGGKQQYPRIFHFFRQHRYARRLPIR